MRHEYTRYPIIISIVIVLRPIQLNTKAIYLRSPNAIKINDDTRICCSIIIIVSFVVMAPSARSCIKHCCVQLAQISLKCLLQQLFFSLFHSIVFVTFRFVYRNLKKKWKHINIAMQCNVNEMTRWNVRVVHHYNSWHVTSVFVNGWKGTVWNQLKPSSTWQ